MRESLLTVLERAMASLNAAQDANLGGGGYREIEYVASLENVEAHVQGARQHVLRAIFMLRDKPPRFDIGMLSW